jgi:putative transcriptional regulator
MTNVKPSAGNILIAEPFLGDPNFERSVILMCEHNDLGSFGLVLNQLSNLKLADMFEEVILDIPIYVGGPVEHNTLHFIHSLGNVVANSTHLGNGVYWGGDFDQLKSMINMGKIDISQVRFFIGYSGWGEGQLERELNKNSWIVAETDSEVVFEEDIAQFWRKVMRGLGGEYKVMSNYPIDPRLN